MLDFEPMCLIPLQLGRAGQRTADFGSTIAFRSVRVAEKARGTPGEVGYDSHHGSSYIRNLSID